MFHQGDLQSGITQAIQQSKSVACFVRDDGEESNTWQDQWLSDAKIRDVIKDNAVILRLTAGSQEANFLAAFCPVDAVPMLIIVQNGILKETMRAGILRQDFESVVLRTLGGSDTEATSSDQSSTNPENASAIVVPPNDAPPAMSTVRDVTVDQSTSPSEAVTTPEEPSRNIPSPIRERPSRAGNPARQGYLEQQRQRNTEARRDRERVLAQIEADKAERKARESERRQLASPTSSSVRQPQSPGSPNSPSLNKRISVATEARLSIRLLDGATVRHDFSVYATLQGDVRPWLVSQDPSLSNQPYTFKQLLAPAPARNITVRDENSTLEEMSFVPSASLVLVAVERGKFVDAYGAGNSGSLWSLASIPYNLATGAASGAYSLMTSATGALAGAVGYGGGMTQGEAAASSLLPSSGIQNAIATGQADDGPRSSVRTEGIRIRTLADQRAENDPRDTQFYNGNQLNFESGEG